MSRRFFCLSVLLCATACALFPLAGRADEPAKKNGAVSIGSRLQLLLDDALLDSMRDVRLELHSPRPAEIVLRKDKPWEDSTLYDPVVMKDGDRYRLWYRTNFNSAPYYTGYAESNDGVEWTKPSLGLIEFQGSKDNNIVWVGDHGKPDGGPSVLSIFKDGKPGIPDDELYKATGIVHGGGMKGLVSPDGLNWRLLQEERVVPAQGAFDSHNITLWDEARGEYVAYVRGFDRGIRRVRRAATRDFRSFPVPDFIAVDNPPGQPVEHLYKNAATSYYRRPDVILMFPKRFFPDRKGDPAWAYPGLSDIAFMFSYDGVRFDRRFREALIRPGNDPLNWHERAIEVGPGLVPTGSGEMSLYYVEHYRTDSVRIRRGVLRVDGLVSLHAGAEGGEAVTRPLIFAGDRLQLNYSTSAAGSIRVELQDADGTPLPGFSLSDCPTVYGDQIEGIVEWKAGADLSALAGKPVRLRFEFNDADVYSFRFDDRPSR